MGVLPAQPVQSPSGTAPASSRPAPGRAIVSASRPAAASRTAARPSAPCRPQGPPTASLACPTTGSSQDGTDRRAAPSAGPGPAGRGRAAARAGGSAHGSVCRIGAGRVRLRRRGPSGVGVPVGVGVGRRSGVGVGVGCPRPLRRPGRSGSAIGVRDAVAVGRRARAAAVGVVAGPTTGGAGRRLRVDLDARRSARCLSGPRPSRYGVHEPLPDRPGQTRPVDDPVVGVEDRLVARRCPSRPRSRSTACSRPSRRRSCPVGAGQLLGAGLARHLPAVVQRVGGSTARPPSART